MCWYCLLTVRTSPALADGGLRPLDAHRLRPSTPIRARAAVGVHRDALPAFVPRSAVLPEGLKVPRRTSPLILTWFGQSAGGAGRARVPDRDVRDLVVTSFTAPGERAAVVARLEFAVTP